MTPSQDMCRQNFLKAINHNPEGDIPSSMASEWHGWVRCWNLVFHGEWPLESSFRHETPNLPELTKQQTTHAQVVRLRRQRKFLR